MGYTHYWYFPSEYEVDTKTWNRIVQDFEKLLNVSYYVPKGLKKLLKTKKTGEEEGWDDRLAITDNHISFNGIGEDGHEPFQLFRKSGTDSYRSTRKGEDCFTFCKTARKPYDTVACSLLIIAQKHLGKLIKISSDGNIEGWRDNTGKLQLDHGWSEANSLCQKHLGYPEACFAKGYKQDDGIYVSDQLSLTKPFKKNSTLHLDVTFAENTEWADQMSKYKADLNCPDAKVGVIMVGGDPREIDSDVGMQNIVDDLVKSEFDNKKSE